jgi:signal transduction histidine kinase
LLLNAIQYGSGDRIGVTAAGEQDAVVLKVHNEGIPIRAELITTIFDPLVRGDDSNQDHTGLGLGLFIVKEIVSAHHGTVAVDSAQNSGTTFTVRPPRLIS